MSAERQQIDVAAYIRAIKTRPCFICEMVNGNPDYRHHIVYEDDNAIVFLSKYPILYGYTLIAPRQHREQVTADFSRDDYLALQSLVYRVAEAVRTITPTERVYILSLGSQQGNRHVHWHVVPLPPGIPFEEQQCEAIRLANGVLPLSYDEMAAIAADIRRALRVED